MAFLDENGVSRLWTHVLSKVGSKVDKIDGKGLSTNDYTTEEKQKLAGIESGAQVNQNAIGTITVNGDTVFTSGAVSDTFKLSSGSNIVYTAQEDGSLNIGVSDIPIFKEINVINTRIGTIRFSNGDGKRTSLLATDIDSGIFSLANTITDLDGNLTDGAAIQITSKGDINTALFLNWYNKTTNDTDRYRIYHEGMQYTIPISQGGTGSSTAAGALANLGGVSSYEPEFTSRITLTADSMPTIFMKASGGNTKQVLIEANTNNGLTFGISSDDTHTNRRYLGVYDPIIAPNLADALQLTSVDNGVYKSYNIFHSGAGGTFGGVAKADATSVSALETAQLRNITISTTDLVEGESTLAEGEVYLVYDGGEA